MPVFNNNIMNIRYVYHNAFDLTGANVNVSDIDHIYGERKLSDVLFSLH